MQWNSHPVRARVGTNWRKIGPFAIRLLMALSLVTCPVVAQNRVRAAAVIDGVVSDTALAPLAQAMLSITGSNVQVVTNGNGRFRITDLGSGQYVLAAHRLGYAPFSIVVQLADGDTARVSIALKPAAVTLDTIRTMVRAISPRLSEFEERRMRGIGQFMTQFEIDRRNSVSVVDLLRSFMSVSIADDGVARNYRAGIARACPFQYFVDGVAIPTPRNPGSELPTTKEIAGIEVYANSATVPMKYQTFGSSNSSGSAGPGGAVCGVIVIWTRGG